jgi:hypothetical protein
MESGQRPGLLSGMSLETLRRAYSAPESELTEEEAASTLFRFFRSTHVVDLRLIVVTILGLLGLYIIIIIVGFVIIISGFVEFILPMKVKEIEPDLAIKLIGPAVAIAGLIISWAYKAASTRLGIIDLFGCEIATICRVGTIFDIGMYYVRAYEGQAGVMDDSAEKRGSSDTYTSKEDYFPIFDKNSSDLQLLEALIVCRITEFYTFMKATRDTQRRLATILPPKETDLPEGAAAGGQMPWHTAALDVVYMIFLGYEAGRKAIHHLVEFEPGAAENTIVIMITELTCYGFLLGKLKGDPRYPRLCLRGETYKEITPMLYLKIVSNHGKADGYWRPARELLPWLRERYERALGETMDEALSRTRLLAEQAGTARGAA